MKFNISIYTAQLSVLLMALAIGGCDKKLDIQPAQSIDQNAALNTSADVQATLVGAYSSLGDRDVYGGRLYVAPDLLADNGDIFWTGTFQGLTQIHNKDIPIDNEFITPTWDNSYAAINVANNVLSALAVVDSAEKARIEGEAKFIRGSLFFELVKLYAKNWADGDPNTNLGIPLVLAPTRVVDESSKVRRNTVAETYTQLIKDLMDAQNLLPNENRFFATKYAAAAMLSRVYLMQGKYTEAAAAADAVISSEEYVLVSTFADEFPYPGQVRVDNTPEDIFAIQISDQSGFNSVNEFFASSRNGGRGDAKITDEHLAKYEEGDDRHEFFNTRGGYTFTSKHSNVYGNIKILRLAEMYLTRAEANFRLGNENQALEDINTVRERANLPGLDPETLTLEAILKERYLELAFEGQSLHDIKRTKGSVGSLPWNSPKLIYPIPQREIIANPNLVQN